MNRELPTIQSNGTQNMALPVDAWRCKTKKVNTEDGTWVFSLVYYTKTLRIKDGT